MNSNFTPLISPPRIWTSREVLSTPCPILKMSGVYAWFFKEIPPYIKVDECVKHKNLYLLYIGISPNSPPRNGKQPSNQTIRDRIRYHYNGNAEGSTLRLTLGCLLSEKLEIQLRRVGSGKRMTFWAGERKLSDWMGENAFVTWIYQEEPWILEEELISKLFLPLNLQMNKHNMNYPIVSDIRYKAKTNARKLPVIPGDY
jgi:hypothetical protein